ncbi:MAG: hypothetical protein HKO65_03780 [Gemmatimonadetes bacterium]|nr:DinB family protein [Gemmatimonadota bacterium]NNM04199.1 hypothetical protein [Gemmatimonadota bacterium]
MLAIHQLVRYWENVRAVTLEYMDIYPPDSLDFKPVDSVFTARDQFQHLISSETMFVRGWLDGLWEFPWREGRWCAVDLVDDSFEYLDGLKRYYEQVHLRALGFLRGLPPEGGSRVLRTHLGDLSIDAMVLYAIDEEIHHRAQIAVYLRMLGTHPPFFGQRYQELTDGDE